MFLLLRFGYIGFHFVKWLNWLELYIYIHIYIYHILLVAYIIFNVALEFLLDG